MSQTIVIGGGLAGLSAAHTILQSGGSVVVIEKNAFCGGNSTKATSGINAAGSRTQLDQGVYDTPQKFYEDTALGARHLGRPELMRTLTYESSDAVAWLQDKFDLDLSILGRLGGHSFPRTHRGKERFPGMTITYALMEKFEEICAAEPSRARLIVKARVTRLLTNQQGEVTGVEYEHKGQKLQENGPVVISTGGYGADFTDDSLLAVHRPELLAAKLSTTNGDHCTGDGIKLAAAIGAGTVDMDMVQVHPTGLVDPADPNSRVRFLAAGALRGTGGLLLDANGRRFCDELGHRDYVTGEMNKGKGPYHLVLNSKCAKEIEWHCKHYTGRGLFAHYNSAAALAAKLGVPVSRLQATFESYNSTATPEKDPYGKKFFANTPWSTNDTFYAGVVTPVIHYTMGGLEVDHEAHVISSKGGPVPGLFASGEVMGGIHGVNRLGGSSLLDCVVFGRVAGRSVSRFNLQRLSSSGGAAQPFDLNVKVDPSGQNVKFEVSWANSGSAAATAPTPVATSSAPTTTTTTADVAVEAPAPVADKNKVYTKEEVAKHNSEKDCWVIVNGEVLDVSGFLKDHPGGKKAILLFAGKDATAEFNMLHKPDVVQKYAPECVIGKINKSNL